MKRLISLILFILTAQPLLACTADLFEIRPARPTSSDPIEVVLRGGCPTGCVPHSPRVLVSGNIITIASQTTVPCILIPQPWGERVDLGTLPAGTYTVVVRHDNRELARRELTVREHPFEVRPAFGVEGQKIFLGHHLADPVRVLFGTVEAAFEQELGVGLFATVPRMNPGLVDVVVMYRDGTANVAAQAFLVPQPQADLSLEHERVFFPSVFVGPGAHGSQWNTQNYVRNRGPIELWTIPYLGKNALPIVTPLPLPVFVRTPIDNEARDGGLLVLAPVGTEKWLAYSSHVVDESRRRTDAGTELPVVHEREAAPQIELLNVPLTNESRQTLRIFDFDAVDGRRVQVRIDVEGRESLFFDAILTQRIVCVTTPCYPRHPTYAVINLDADPRLRGAGSADITILARTNDAPLWAYVSVTNNDTQHVTTSTPQHRHYSQ
jgi:hypothetical protein